MIKYIGIGIASLALVGCTQAAPTPVVTVTAPAPTVTAPAPVQDEDTAALEYAWSTLSSNEKEGVCLLLAYSPEEAWDSFNEGADGTISRSAFNAFFAEKCSTY